MLTTRNGTLAISVVALLTMLFSFVNVRPARAAPVGQIDQEQASPASTDPQGPRIGAALNQTLKQTFTAGRSGALTDVSIYGHLQNTPPPGDLVILVAQAGGTVLASASVAGDSFLADPFTDRWITGSFASPPSVSAGTQYTIVVTSTQPSVCDPDPDTCNGIYYIAFDPSDPYPGGSLSVIDQYGIEIPFPSFDIAFRTYVASLAPAEVSIDIKPGSIPNKINPGSLGVIPVAILTTGTFDATTVDPNTVRFGATGTETASIHFALEDVDADDDTDLILHFKTRSTRLLCGDTSASLIGNTYSGQIIAGSDSIRTTGCK